MNKPLITMFDTQLKNLKGTEFQSFVTELFCLKYSETGFTILRETKDKGCDGIIVEEKRIIACYGDDLGKDSAKRKKDFYNKVNNDFKKYEDNWKKLYPNWAIVINNEIDPDYDLFVKSKNLNATVIGIKQLLEIIKNLKNFQRKKLGDTLKIDKEYLKQDCLREILEDLSASEIDKSNILYDKKSLLNVKSKIELNYNIQDVEDAINDFANLLESGSLDLVKELLSSYNDTDIAKIKCRVSDDFSRLKDNDFKQMFNCLVDNYVSRYSCEGDDDYLLCVKSLLFCLFEQCLIGKKE